jgi:hypothetical protein
MDVARDSGKDRLFENNPLGGLLFHQRHLRSRREKPERP